MARLVTLLVVACFFIASQLFWIRRLAALVQKLISSARMKKQLAWGGAICYIVLLEYDFHSVRHSPSPVHLTLGFALLVAPFRWWVAGSILGFGLVLVFEIGVRLFKTGRLAYRKLRPHNPCANPADISWERRKFLSASAQIVGGLPFAAGAYGLLYGRLNFEKSFVRVKLRRLPHSFHGFRIAQLSDIHISPFMGTREIRRVVGMTNALKADLILLTGDYVTWDPTTQGAVVGVLSDLRAPFGVYGCLGNHELWTHTEDSITRLFASCGIRILRKERVVVQSGRDWLNLIGVDFESHRSIGPHGEGKVREYLEGVRSLVDPNTANILLSHNPNTFDRAAELHIDLSLAGHTHGGQISLEFISRELSPARLITPYTRGWFQKPGAQLYVNRGIGTIGVPIRFDAPPEITVFELLQTT